MPDGETNIMMMDEDALARLEAGLRAQREKLGMARQKPSPSISPMDQAPLTGPDDGARQQSTIRSFAKAFRVASVRLGATVAR